MSNKLILPFSTNKSKNNKTFRLLTNKELTKMNFDELLNTFEKVYKEYYIEEATPSLINVIKRTRDKKTANATLTNRIKKIKQLLDETI